MLTLLLVWSQGAARTADASTPHGAPAPATDSRGPGVALGLDFVDAGRSYVSLLWEAASHGATAVSLVVELRQTDVHAAALIPGPDGPITARSGDLRRAIRDAHALGLETMLLPIIQLDARSEGDWRGVLAPATPEAWWASYGAALLWIAELAEEEGVSMLSIGSELASMEDDIAAWAGLVGRIRGVYGGRLTYSSNWDRFAQTPLWGLVDAVGVSAYFEVGRGVAPGALTASHVMRQWSQHARDIVGVARGWGVPAVVTELGFPNGETAGAAPWDYQRPAGPAPMLQAMLLGAAMSVLARHPEIERVYVWNWFGDGGVVDRGYSPRQKPAGVVLRRASTDSPERGQ